MNLRIGFLGWCLLLVSASGVRAQDDAYTRVITERAAKITATLGLTDAGKADRVTQLIAGQYRRLNDLQESRKTEAADLKAKEAPASEMTALESRTEKKRNELHDVYIKALSSELTAAQVDQVKDGMTYRVLPITYQGYLDMLPNLTAEQKSQILSYLTEAREHAMDAETSEKKHAWFGKYKGKINNYLSASGIDMKKAGQEWQERRNARH